jgi:hypothetical protein
MAEYTPGPWTLGNGGYPHGAEYEVRTAGSEDLYIVGVQWASSPDELGYMPPANQAYANARLIASAPDLLEALEELHLKAVVGTDDERHAALNKAWAAIAKARGSAD